MKRRKNPDQVDRQPLINQAKISQNMQEDVAKYPGKIVRFTHDATKDMIFCFSATLFAFAFIAICDLDKMHRLFPNPMFMLIPVLGFGAYGAALCAWFQIQRVEIDTENKTIRFADTHTYQLCRIFSLNDVISIRALIGMKGRRGISVRLAPSSSRGLEYVNLDNLDAVPKRDPVDSELFLALVQQIRCVHPDMKISGMLPNYRGVLPKEICEFDGRW